ncbi:MAG: transposase [Chloroflexales bacterium]|nr:transposase [Chloroflexales bacterium]
MRLTIQLKLQPTPQQAALLRQTLHAANAACNAISETAWRTREFKQFGIHKLTYYDTKDAFNLSAQLVVRCIAKVAHTYKLDTKTQRAFKPLGAVAFDDRILSYKTDAVSIWTIQGRQTIPFVCGQRQRVLLANRVGESDLVCVRGEWRLLTTAEVATEERQSVTDVVGIDLGVTNIATDSDGVIHQANTIKNVRYRHRRLRQKLQKKGMLGSRRRLRALAGQERRFATWVNHNLSKQIVAKAKRTKRAIALEDLTHIRTRVRARRSQRATLHIGHLRNCGALSATRRSCRVWLSTL